MRGPENGALDGPVRVGAKKRPAGQSSVGTINRLRPEVELRPGAQPVRHFNGRDSVKPMHGLRPTGPVTAGHARRPSPGLDHWLADPFAVHAGHLLAGGRLPAADQRPASAPRAPCPASALGTISRKRLPAAHQTAQQGRPVPAPRTNRRQHLTSHLHRCASQRSRIASLPTGIRDELGRRRDARRRRLAVAV